MKLDIQGDFLRRNVDVLSEGLHIGYITRAEGTVKEAFSRAHHVSGIIKCLLWSLG